MDPIARLAALYEAATPGEWVDANQIIEVEGYNLFHYEFGEANFTPDDAAYIAHAHNLMPKILDVLRAADKADIAELRRQRGKCNCNECEDFYVGPCEKVESELTQLNHALAALCKKP